MNVGSSKSQIALAVIAALGSAAMMAPMVASAAKVPGKYVAGDIHNHTTCSDGTISMQKLVKKSTDTVETPFGLDWFVQAGHGGNGNRNCTLVEDATLSTPAYPFVNGQSPQTTWTASIGAANIKGQGGGVGGNGNMWRWQSVQEFQYPLIEYLRGLKQFPLFIGLETVNPGHEHTSMSIITGQVPTEIDNNPTLPSAPPYVPLGNANALAQWEYCFDRQDTDNSRGNVTGTSTGNNWDCSVPGSANASNPDWSAVAQKLSPQPPGGGVGIRGHLKSLEALKWMNAFHPDGSYFLPTHLERAGPFNSEGNNGFNVEHLRNFNNTAPRIAFGFETQPGHGAAGDRGEYLPRRQVIQGVPTDSVGGTTYGGTGVYGAQVGGVWDSLLGEGRNFWFFASSDWHSRSFGPDDRRSAGDFFPGEYQRAYSLVRNNGGKLRPQGIVDAMRTGNSFSTGGQLIDRLAFIACVSYPGPAARTNATVETWALTAAVGNTDTDITGCATMGEKLKVRAGAEIVVGVVVRDPSGPNFSPYTFNNPSLAQVNIQQPINQPVLDHIDLIRGLVTGYKNPGAADYYGEWPRNTAWLHDDGSVASLDVVPAGAKNTSAAVIKKFNGTGGWTSVVGSDGQTYLKMSFRIPAVQASQYVRLRGTNLPPSVPFETNANGDPLPDIFTNASNPTRVRIPCTVVHSTGNQFDGCPDHMVTAANTAGQTDNPIAGQKAVSFDVAAWSDLWFYSNPIYVEVGNSTIIAGVQ